MLKDLRYNLSKQVVYRLFTVLLHLNLIYCSSVYPLSTMKSTGSSSSCSECKPTPEPLPENIPSFYQRKLPETCIAFASREGKNIFKSSLEKDGLKSFYNLIEQHHTQTEPAFCGVSTLVMVLNSLAVDPGQHWKGPWRWYSEEMLNCCVDMDDIKKAGITLRDFHCLALCQGLSVDLQYCDETSSLDAFREAVERACVGSDDDDDDDDDEQQKDEGKNRFEVMVVSYSRAVLKQTGSGHFSPIAAYDKASDSVLILDTARFKYGAHWTKLPLIYDAMKPIDPDTGKPRGYALLSFVPDSQRCVEVSKCKNANDVSKQKVSKQKSDNKKSKTTSSALSTQPASIIFRSKMNQKQRRRLYKEYITCLRRDEKYKGGDIPYDAVRAFGAKRDSNRPVRVWEIIEPVRVNSVEENQMLQRMRKVLKNLKEASNATATATENDHIDDNQFFKPPNHINLEETLFFIYLATLSKERRYELVMRINSDGSCDIARTHILMEADIIARAIELSDQLTSI